MDRMDANLSPLNRQLRGLYEGHWNPVRETLQPYWDHEQGISLPLLLKANEAYEGASRKLVIVGQQTSGWGNPGQPLGDNPIGRLMDEYADFALGRWYRPTAFYQASYVLHMMLNPTGPAFGFMWTNLIKVDEDLNRPAREIEEFVIEKFPVVAAELKILGPDVVVFFTGPAYDDVLAKTFRNVEMRELDGFRINEFARVEGTGLPQLSFRTYHPTYMSWRDSSTHIYGRVMRKLAKVIGAVS
jgi:hypothetical protein